MIAHEHLIKLYEENNNLRAKSIKTTIILTVFLAVIVCAMNIFQMKASVGLNIAATSCVTFLAFWHFKDFKYRLTLNERKVSIVLEGVQIERSRSFSKPAFFLDYLKKFSILRAAGLTTIAIFDLFFLYSFGTCMIKLLKELNPAILTKLVFPFPIIASIASTCAVLVYYQPIRPLVFLKKELAESPRRAKRG